MKICIEIAIKVRLSTK